MAAQTNAVRTTALFMVIALLVGACSESPVEVVAGSDSGDVGDEGSALQAVLESENALIADPGDGWSEVDRWYTEGAMTHWGTGCSGFDRLGDMFNAGTPVTVVWANGDDRMFQRTDDFGWDAAEFADDVALVPEVCPSVEIGSLGSVSTTAVDSSVLGEAVDRVVDDDPTARLVAIEFNAYPHPSLETDIATPEFEVGRPSWMVIATRHNVVSQLVYSPGDGSGPERLPELVSAQVDALLGTPIEASGPFRQAEPPPSVEPGTAVGVELFVDPFTCRNDGFVEHDGIRWVLTEGVPFEWRERNPIVGDMDMEGTTAQFTAYPGPPPVEGEETTDVDGEVPPLDAFTVTLTTGAVESVCITWERPTEAPPLNKVGRLDCDDRLVQEVRVPNTGQAPEDLAVEANPQVTKVEPDGPLWWVGLDGGGWVVVTIALGDAPDADWQIWTCESP